LSRLTKTSPKAKAKSSSSEQQLPTIPPSLPYSTALLLLRILVRRELELREQTSNQTQIIFEERLMQLQSHRESHSEDQLTKYTKAAAFMKTVLPFDVSEGMMTIETYHRIKRQRSDESERLIGKDGRETTEMSE